MSIIEFDSIGGARGNLVSLESMGNIPFEIKRSYYIYNTVADYPRGFHAHKELIQVAVCLSGSCVMKMDNGTEINEYVLDSPAKGVLIDKMYWHEMHSFTDSCILLVVASDLYDESDYIRNYDDFKRLVKEVKLCRN